MATLLQLSLCVLIVVKLTSSQSTYDVIQQENDVNSCQRTDEVLSQLMTAMVQLQREVAELKAFSLRTGTVCINPTGNPTVVYHHNHHHHHHFICP